jgi:hypothetical protein
LRKSVSESDHTGRPRESGRPVWLRSLPSC